MAVDCRHAHGSRTIARGGCCANVGGGDCGGPEVDREEGLPAVWHKAWEAHMVRAQNRVLGEQLLAVEAQFL